MKTLDYLKRYRGLGMIRLLSKRMWHEIKQETLSQGKFEAVITWSFGNLLGVFVPAKKYLFVVPMWPGAKIKYKWWERILAAYHPLNQGYQDFLMALQKIRRSKIVIFLPPQRGDIWEDGKILYDRRVVKEMQEFAFGEIEIIELPVRGHRKAVTEALNIQKILSALIASLFF